MNDSNRSSVNRFAWPYVKRGRRGSRRERQAYRVPVGASHRPSAWTLDRYTTAAPISSAVRAHVERTGHVHGDDLLGETAGCSAASPRRAPPRHIHASGAERPDVEDVVALLTVVARRHRRPSRADAPRLTAPIRPLVPRQPAPAPERFSRGITACLHLRRPRQRARHAPPARAAAVDGDRHEVVETGVGQPLGLTSHGRGAVGSASASNTRSDHEPARHAAPARTRRGRSVRSQRIPHVVDRVRRHDRVERTRRRRGPVRIAEIGHRT